MKNQRQFTVPFGKGSIEFELPSEMSGIEVVSRHVPPVSDVPEAIVAALDNPVNSPPLRDIARQGDKVCIVFTDITRANPDQLLVPALLRELETAGVNRDDVTLLCGIGLHRPSTPEEKIEKLGAETVANYRVIDNEPMNPDAMIDLGVVPWSGAQDAGIPLSVHRAAYEADLLIATGVVEPHQYAGYSGARKTLAVGAAGEKMIAYTHGPKMIDHPGTRLAKIEENPFHEAITEAAKRANLRFILNVVLDDDKKPVAIFAGEPVETFKELVNAARAVYEVPIQQQYDVAVAGVGYPKDENLYQASRAASYLFFAPISVVKEGGVFIIPAPTAEGAGDGVGEQRFLRTMQSESNMSTLLANLRRTGYPPGAQRAFVMAKVLEQTHVIIVGSETPDVVRQINMIPVDTMDQAFRKAQELIGKAELDVVVVPHALLTLPVVGLQERNHPSP